jgi:hypothetical protein
MNECCTYCSARALAVVLVVINSSQVFSVDTHTHKTPAGRPYVAARSAITWTLQLLHATHSCS